jgi:NADH-quinone oxidoreductase subunit I
MMMGCGAANCGGKPAFLPALSSAALKGRLPPQLAAPRAAIG